DEDANIIFGAVVDESMGDEVRITEIATGFGESTVAHPAPRPQVEQPLAAESGQDLRGPDVAPDGRPMRGDGLREVDEYELEVPTWQRRHQAVPIAAERSTPRSNGFDSDDSDFDIPTFLRRSAE